ncbi:N-acyl-D-amino-acid deacylase family protein [Anaeroselena agilis]|uniref:D-aminoacylase n=1 Tax=Anaeroselena agilis TaxID=3063788 RepID=A0ABU3NXC7_9FIRM|nr:D-aminoacylase [Selenomonadales bacterium 4137-cl]
MAVNYLLKDGLVLDGSGRAGARADVLLAEGKIVAMGPQLSAAGAKVIDADGLVVAPGFIDSHTHSDRTVFHAPLGPSKVMQGVTTEVMGNCGIGLFPVGAGRRRRELETYLATMEGELPPGGIDWEDMDGYASAVERIGPGRNLAPMVAHGALRIAVMGSDDRVPTAAEMDEMKTLLSRSLKQGAWGMSTGLIYPPGSFAATAELAELAGVLAANGAVYASHIRGESKTLPAAVEEAVSIAASSGARVLISHLKAIGQPYWGQGRAALARLDEARSQGVDVWADQYPYEATSTSLTALLPGWVQDGGTEAMLWRLADADLHSRIRQAVREEMTVRGGPERVRIASLRTGANGKYVGRSIAELAWDRLLAPEDAVVALLKEEGGAVEAIYFSLSSEDLEGIIVSDFVAVGSDGSGLDPAKDGGKMVHPRNYGTFPRVLGRYVREQGLLSLEAAVRKMTALPAAIFGIRGRGLLQPGYNADIVAFDPGRIRDRADFADPHRYPEGIEHVFVNGVPAVAAGRLTGDGRGEVLRRRG